MVSQARPRSAEFSKRGGLTSPATESLVRRKRLLKEAYRFCGVARRALDGAESSDAVGTTGPFAQLGERFQRLFVCRPRAFEGAPD